MHIARLAHLVVAWVFVAGVVLQVFFAGLGVFDNPRAFMIHATWGYMLELLPIVLLVLVGIGRLGRRMAVYAVVLFAMFLLQSVFVALRGDLPAVAALHPVNGFAILLVGIAMAREAWATRERQAGVGTVPATTPAGAARGVAR